MPAADRNKAPPADEKASRAADRSERDDMMDEEEKVLAGRPDANMPALLTKDVPGG